MIILRYIFLIGLSFLPSLFWLLVIRFLDRQEPEPVKTVVKIFIWGIIIGVPAFIIAKLATSLLDSIHLSVLASIIISSFLIDGLIEETAKYAVIRDKVFKLPDFNEPLDGLVYGVTVGLGLAFFENALIVITSGAEILILRAVTATLMHALAGGIIGYYFGVAKFIGPGKHKVKNKLISYGLILAIVFHAIYNTIAKAKFAWNLIPLAILLIGVYVAVLRGVRKMRRVLPQGPK